MKFSILSIPLIVILMFSGCVRGSQEDQFAQVQQDIFARTEMRIEWDRNMSGDVTNDEMIAVILEDGLTIDEAVQVALLNNPDLQAVYEDLGIAQAQVIEALLPPNPIFEGTFEFLEQGGTVTELAFVDDFVAILLIPLNSKFRKAQRDSTKIFLEMQVLKLAFETRIAYLEYLTDREILDLKERILVAKQLSYEMACRLRAAGNITVLDLEQKRAAYEDIKVEVAMAELQYVRSREELNRTMALWGKATHWHARDELPGVPDDEWLPVDFESIAIDSSLDLLRSSFLVTARERNLDIKKITSILPSFEAGVEMEIEEGHGWSYIGPTWNFPIPLFDWGFSERAIARGKLRKQWREFTGLAIEIRSTVRESHQQLITARQKALYYESVIVPLQEQIMNQTHLRFNGMLLGVFELLQTKTEEYRTHIRYLETVRDYWVSRTEFREILNGRLVRNTSVNSSRREQMGSEGAAQNGH